jgi:hypothetical protein
LPALRRVHFLDYETVRKGYIGLLIIKILGL